MATMKARTTARKAASGRGSPEAIAKRRIARKLNQLFAGKGDGSAPRDGRTERRRQRLIAEIDKATRKGGKGLKPIELLLRVNALLELGENTSTIRKAVHSGVARQLPPDQAASILRDVHAAYQFRPQAYRFLGLPHDALVAAGILAADAPRRGRPPKAAAPKKRAAAKARP